MQNNSVSRERYDKQIVLCYRLVPLLSLSNFPFPHPFLYVLYSQPDRQTPLERKKTSLLTERDRNFEFEIEIGMFWVFGEGSGFRDGEGEWGIEEEIEK